MNKFITAEQAKKAQQNRLKTYNKKVVSKFLKDYPEDFSYLNHFITIASADGASHIHSSSHEFACIKTNGSGFDTLKQFLEIQGYEVEKGQTMIGRYEDVFTITIKW